VLCTRFNTEATYFLSDSGTRYQDDGIFLLKDQLGYQGLIEIGWATPEALQRRRSNAKLFDLATFLKTNAIGAIVSIPRGSARPSTLVILRQRVDEVPYTFAEIERIQILAELIDSTITRSQLTAQAALRARMEYLALMSRGLAHDLKNLITPISEYLNFCNGKYAPNTNEQIIHDAAQRSMRSIADYVHESLAFSKGLEPRFEAVSVLEICKNVIASAGARAERRDIRLSYNCSSSGAMNADRILIERMLANIISNAIDASSAQQTVSLNVHATHEDRILFEICDNGTGIQPQNIHRIFDPCFTTKTLEGEERGIGLGLTIASNIVFLHDGYITARSEPGCQTIITVDLPADRASGGVR
jgi:signal transduction histidine kinase